MRKIINTLLLLLLFCSCDDKYSGIDYPVEDNKPDYEITEDKVPLVLAMNDPYYTILTRGYGAMSENNPWIKHNATYYVSAYLAKNSAYDGNVDYTKNMDDGGDIKYCLLNDKLTGCGVPVTYTDNGMLNFPNDDIYYYDLVHQDWRYNFFLYYCDDAVINDIEKTTDKIQMEISIDGTQDVITAVARPTSEQIKALGEDVNNKWLLSNLYNLAYSTTTGHRAIMPVYQAKHHLSRFVFNLHGEDALSDSIYIQDIYVESKTNGVMTVAANDTASLGIEFPNDKNENLVQLHLCDTVYPGSPMNGLVASMQPYKYHVKKGEEINNLGEGFLLPPSEAYSLYIKCSQRKPEGGEIVYTAKYKLRLDNVTFLPGYVYTVDVYIFGYQPIKLSLQGGIWLQGEDIILDDEDGVEY